jgi:hypothetical protein
MAKTLRKYWEEIRLPATPPGKAMPTDKDYNRKRDKKVIMEEDKDD